MDCVIITIDINAYIVANRPNKRTLLSGNQYGEVYAYVLPDTTDMTHYVRDDRYKDCMGCGRAFSVLGMLWGTPNSRNDLFIIICYLERKNNCRSCGGKKRIGEVFMNGPS